MDCKSKYDRIGKLCFTSCLSKNVMAVLRNKCRESETVKLIENKN